MMMSTNTSTIPGGRRQHEIPYTPTAQPPYPHQFHFHQHAVPQQYHPQWYQTQMPSIRQYPQYPPMVPSQYPLMHNTSSLPSRPNAQQHAPYSSTFRSQMLSPPPAGVRPPPSPSSVTRSRPSPPPAPPPITRRMPYYPPLPWYSVPEAEFPSRAARRRRVSSSRLVELPSRTVSSPSLNIPQDVPSSVSDVPSSLESSVHTLEPSGSGSATPTTSQAPSETESTHPTTPSSAVPPPIPRSQQQQPIATAKTANRQPGRVIPAVPIVPNISTLSRAAKRQSISNISATAKPEQPASNNDHIEHALEAARPELAEEELVASEEIPSESSLETKTAPKSWADLVRTKAPAGSQANDTEEATGLTSNGFTLNKAGSLSDVLSSFSVNTSSTENRVAFLKPRGLVNTGNMCYMNSILQILVFCVPFYDFLDKVGKQAAYSFKSETPLMDAMIMFMREFPIIDSATSVDQLRMRLQESELEDYGDAFIPEFVYDVIRRLPRFSTMRRGHQQDAEEFLGFLLEGMHEECTKTMKSVPSQASSPSSSTVDRTKSPDTEGGDNGWLEVGPRQKSAITRSSGVIAVESPINKIFGGKLRSELRVPGAKTSVTLEPYQPLQLDIGSPQVSNISDALKGLTRSETLHGDFNSPRGPGVAATKQVFIETLPPVLVLHLKRFQYENTGGTQKIWKKVGYPLELEIPKEVFPQHRRGALTVHGGLPKYRLIGVVYHHGKNASGGHYTVDVRRQDGREWVRLDDTVIRRVRSEDVAEAGSEEDPKVLAAALEQHKQDQKTSNNIYEQTGEDELEKTQAETGWSQVNNTAPNSANHGKKWSGIVNGMATPTNSSGIRTPVPRFSVKDNKVAYILFYQRMDL